MTQRLQTSTAATYADQIKQYAYSKASVPYSYSPEQNRCILVPITISLFDGDGVDVHEQILWKLGDPEWEPRSVAARFCFEFGLPSSLEGSVEEEIKRGLQLVTGWNDLGGEKLVQLKVYVRLGDTVLLDDVQWDLNSPDSTAHGYAASVCTHLGLSFTWFEAVNTYMQRRLAEAIQDLKTCPEVLDLLPVPTSVIRPATAAEDVPRLVPYDPESDAEAHRQRRRSELLAVKVKVEGGNQGTTAVVKKEEGQAQHIVGQKEEPGNLEAGAIKTEVQGYVGGPVGMIID